MTIKRTQAHEIETRRRRVSLMYSRKATQWEIADTLGVNQSTVSRDIAAIEDQWRKDASQRVEELKAAELGELREMEREVAGAIVKADTTQGERARLMQVRLNIKARIAKLMGIDAPTKIAPTNIEGDESWSPMPLDEAIRVLGLKRDD